MTTTDPTKPHICTADGGPACPGHTPNCEPGCAQPAAADSTGRPPRADAEAWAAENARLREQLAEAREHWRQVADALARAETERDQARAEIARLERAAHEHRLRAEIARLERAAHEHRLRAEIDRLRAERDRLRRRLGDVLDLEELPEDHTIVAAVRRLRAALGSTPDTGRTA